MATLHKVAVDHTLTLREIDATPLAERSFLKRDVDVRKAKPMHTGGGRSSAEKRTTFVCSRRPTVNFGEHGCTELPFVPPRPKDEL